MKTLFLFHMILILNVILLKAELFFGLQPYF